MYTIRNDEYGNYVSMYILPVIICPIRKVIMPEGNVKSNSLWCIIAVIYSCYFDNNYISYIYCFPMLLISCLIVYTYTQSVGVWIFRENGANYHHVNLHHFHGISLGWISKIINKKLSFSSITEKIVMLFKEHHVIYETHVTGKLRFHFQSGPSQTTHPPSHPVIFIFHLYFCIFNIMGSTCC